ncbi:L-threonine 3-dehydrogenase [candidate division KSB1 bacterium]
MSEKMKAVAKTKSSPGAELIETAIPEVREDEVLVKVKATSICGSDVHIYNWDNWAQSRVKTFPRIMGHEFAGEVVEVGNNVKKIKAGDLISAETHIPCQSCIQCLTGQMHICGNLKILSLDTNGCFAEYAVVPEIVCWVNDKSIPFEFASVQEPLGNAVYCSLVEPVTGKTVLIMGDGPTSLFAAGVCKVAGASQVYVVGLSPYRLEIAKKMGADLVLNNKTDNTVEIILDKTDGVGVDVVLEMAGAQETITQGFQLVRKGGRFSAFGIAAKPVELDINNAVIFKGVTVYGINGRLMFDTWFKVRNLLASKKLDISPVVTHKLKLEDFEKGFDLMRTFPQKCGKVVLFP